MLDALPCRAWQQIFAVPVCLFSLPTLDCHAPKARPLAVRAYV
jgi:hypothetical protein